MTMKASSNDPGKLDFPALLEEVKKGYLEGKITITESTTKEGERAAWLNFHDKKVRNIFLFMQGRRPRGFKLIRELKSLNVTHQP